MPDKKTSKDIFIVEDDMIISMVLEKMVKKLGYNVLDKATEGKKAIKKVQKKNPDLILMDIQLSDEVDGISAMQQIRLTSEVPVIYITGNSDPYYRTRAQKTNFVDYLIKPIQLEQLKRSIDKAFSESA